MVPPGRLEYYYTYSKGDDQEPVICVPDSMTKESTDRLLRLMKNKRKDIQKPTWQNVISRIYSRDVLSNIRYLVQSNAAERKTSGGQNLNRFKKMSVVHPKPSEESLRNFQQPPPQRCIMYLDSLALISVNLDSFCTNALPRLGLLKGLSTAYSRRAWNINTSIFSNRVREADSRNYYDENYQTQVIILFGNASKCIAIIRILNATTGVCNRILRKKRRRWVLRL